MNIGITSSSKPTDDRNVIQSSAFRFVCFWFRPRADASLSKRSPFVNRPIDKRTDQRATNQQQWQLDPDRKIGEHIELLVYGFVTMRKNNAKTLQLTFTPTNPIDFGYQLVTSGDVGVALLLFIDRLKPFNDSLRNFFGVQLAHVDRVIGTGIINRVALSDQLLYFFSSALVS